MNRLLEWWVKATSAQKRQLAAEAKSSLGSIRFAAKGYREEEQQPDVSAEFAARLELAAEVVGGGLPELKREDICATCRTCPYQIQCNTKGGGR